ncbi:PPE domain-containing protein [Lentzea sp. NPDC004782]|uniref:PPE domain-containing protein n=1 Tax=Lentzea sp. NPDC004782 TaxID=3154458 RepID=UPI0033A0706A
MLPFAGGETVYKWFESGKGPSQSTAPTAQAWRDLSAGHTQVADLINKAVSDSGASWEGAAADTARSKTSPLATWADVTGQSASDAGRTADSIGEAYVNAKYAMQKPPEVPDKPFLNDVWPWDTDYDKAVEKNQQVSEANMRAFTQYGDAVTASTSSMPTFISPDASDAGMQEQGTGQKNISKVDKPGTSDGYTPPGTSQPPGTSRPGDNTNLSGWKPPSDNTNPSWMEPGAPTPGNPPPGSDPSDPRNRPPGDTAIPPGGRWDPNNPNDPRNRGRLNPNDPRNRPGGPGGPGGRGLGGPGGGGGGAGGRGGGMGGGAGGLGGAAAARAGGPGGMGSGFGGAAGVSEQGRGGAGGFGPAGAGGAAGRGGAAGMGAGGMGHGAKGEGDEDKEHKSASYLQETEDIFGDGTMVAPPVIGG